MSKPPFPRRRLAESISCGHTQKWLLLTLFLDCIQHDSESEHEGENKDIDTDDEGEGVESMGGVKLPSAEEVKEAEERNAFIKDARTRYEAVRGELVVSANGAHVSPDDGAAIQAMLMAAKDYVTTTDELFAEFTTRLENVGFRG